SLFPRPDASSRRSQRSSLSWLISCYGVFDRPGIFYTLRGVQNLQPDNVAILVVVENHAGLVFVTFLNGRVAEQDAEHIYLGVVGNFHIVLLSIMGKGEFHSPSFSPASCPMRYLIS